MVGAMTVTVRPMLPADLAAAAAVGAAGMGFQLDDAGQERRWSDNGGNEKRKPHEIGPYSLLPVSFTPSREIFLP